MGRTCVDLGVVEGLAPENHVRMSFAGFFASLSLDFMDGGIVGRLSFVAVSNGSRSR